MNKFRIEFSIFGSNINFQELTNICNTTPTKISKRGDKLTYTVSKEDSWNIIYSSDDSNDFELLIEKLIKNLKHSAGAIDIYCTQNNLQIKLFVCASFGEKYVPSFYFSKESLKFFYSIGLEIDFDLYLI